MANSSVSNQEIEAKFLSINKSAMIDKLESLGAQKEFTILYRRKVFDYPDRRLDKDDAWLRLRDEGEQTTLTYKRRIGVTDSHAGNNDQGMEELEVIVGDFDTMSEILLKTGLELKHYAENRRTRYLLNDVEVDIDEWPMLEPYLEIEANNWPAIDDMARKLGIDPQTKMICSTNQIYARSGIVFNDFQYITFHQQIRREE